MATSTEQIAIWVLQALKEEWERDPSRMTCRTEAAVLGPLKTKHGIEDVDITRGIRFLVERRALDAVNREDGRATLPNATGFEILAAHNSAQRREAEQEQRRRMDRGTSMRGWIAIIISVLSFIIAVIALLRK